MEIYNQSKEDDIRNLLVGKRIVKAETGEFDNPDAWYSRKAAGRLELDDGTVVLVHPNEGCGGCNAGWYYLDSLAATPNAITSVELAEEPESDEDFTGTYKIYVICDNEKITAVQITGSDGNGYYGTGYELYVTLPGEGDGERTD